VGVHAALWARLDVKGDLSPEAEPPTLPEVLAQSPKGVSVSHEPLCEPVLADVSQELVLADESQEPVLAEEDGGLSEHTMEAAAVMIQARHRGLMSRRVAARRARERRLEQLEEELGEMRCRENAALRIQARWRGKQARCRLAEDVAKRVATVFQPEAEQVSVAKTRRASRRDQRPSYARPTSSSRNLLK